MANLRVLIADEDSDSRVSLKRALARAELELAGETGYGVEAVSLALEAQPDVILIAVEEPTARALDTADGLANALPSTPIIIYSSDGDAEAVRKGMIFGARDYLVKPVDSTRLRDAISTVMSQEERRQMRRAGQMQGVQGRGTVITVAGAKGGIGKSMLAVNLAVALRQETGRSVAIIDADNQFGDVATLLDVTPQVTVRELVAGRRELDRSNLKRYVTPHPLSGTDVVAASEEEEAWSDCTPAELHGIVDQFAQVYDFVVVDTAGPMDQFVRACIECSTLTLLVCSGDVSAVRDTAAAVRRLDRWGIDDDRVRYVLNTGAHEEGISADDLSRAIGRKVFWVIPHDRAVFKSIQVGQPVVLSAPKSRCAVSIVDLARRIGGQKDSARADNKPNSLWRRLMPSGTSDVRGDNDDSSMGRFSAAVEREG